MNGKDYYHLTDNIIDVIRSLEEERYVPITMMCLSFQYGKHLSTDRWNDFYLMNESDAS